ncbi:MAG: SCO family protein [Gammaproteobacteria bacterium]|nr:SCO family protein [Gammaproteobacteria bacterium]
MMMIKRRHNSEQLQTVKEKTDFILTGIFSLLFFIPVQIFAQEIVTEGVPEQKLQSENEVLIDVKGRGGDFSLIGKDGWVSLSDFRGKVVAIYFGYTKCPDVCPTNLSFISSAINGLKPEEKQNFQSIFISVDPGRDSPDTLAEYVKYFDDEMIGLSAAPDDLDPVVAQYGAYYEKVPYSNSALMYGVDHTSETYIVGKKGTLFAILPHATKSENILETIREAMQQ